jgi:DNA-directed RNA polymerase sigma subunit (sigma70/sigma32)
LLQNVGKTARRARKLSDVTTSPDPAGELLDHMPPKALTRRQRRERTSRALATAATTGSHRRREALLDYVVRLNLCVAHDVASRHLQLGPDEDEIFRVAYHALARAAHDFEPEQDEDFLSYAVSVIRREIAEHGGRAWAVPGATGWTPGT